MKRETKVKIMRKILIILVGFFLLGTLGNLYARRGRVIENPIDIVDVPYQNQVSSPPVESFYRADMLDPEQLRGSDGFWSAGMSTAPGRIVPFSIMLLLVLIPGVLHILARPEL